MIERQTALTILKTLKCPLGNLFRIKEFFDSSKIKKRNFYFFDSRKLFPIVDLSGKFEASLGKF